MPQPATIVIIKTLTRLRATIWPAPGMPIRSMRQERARSGRHWLGRTCSGVEPLMRKRTDTAAAMAWESTVAMAAPRTPIAGSGPEPNMKIGSSTRLSTFATPMIHMGVQASPAP